MPTNTVRAVLEAYAVTGVLGLARRDGNRRYYDLIERLLPAEVLAQRHPAERAAPAQAPVALPRARPARRRRRRRTSSAGSARRSRTRGGRSTRDGHALREELVERGELVPVEVEGVRGKRFVLREDVELLRSAAGAAAVGRVPLPVRPARLGPRAAREPVRLRLRVGALPAAGEAPLGLVRAADRLPRPLRRPDRAADRPRRAAACRCSDVWWEDGFAPRRADGFVDAMRDALRAYLRFAGASRLEWAPHLAAEKRLFLARP